MCTRSSSTTAHRGSRRVAGDAEELPVLEQRPRARRRRRGRVRVQCSTGRGRGQHRRERPHARPVALPARRRARVRARRVRRPVGAGDRRLRRVRRDGPRTAARNRPCRPGCARGVARSRTLAGERAAKTSRRNGDHAPRHHRGRCDLAVVASGAGSSAHPSNAREISVSTWRPAMCRPSGRNCRPGRSQCRLLPSRR